jgi:hypothetical protein
MNPRDIISSKWEDPTLANPIRRTMPWGQSLYVEKPKPRMLGDVWVKWTCILIGVFAVVQTLRGWM